MSAPLVVNTRDGVCWTRRTVTSGGLALYAPESVRTCPDFVMATLAELAEHGIAGSADALPMPVALEPDARSVLDRARDALGARMAKDSLRLVLENVVTYAAELERQRNAFRDQRNNVVATNEQLHDKVTEAFEARLRAENETRTVKRKFAEAAATVAQLVQERGERMKVENALRDEAEELRARLAEYERPADEDPIAYALTEQADAAGYPPALPWARLLDHEDLTDFLDELAASAITHATSEVALTEVEDTIGRWRVIGEAQHAHNTAPGPDADEPGMRPAVRTIGGDA